MDKKSIELLTNAELIYKHKDYDWYYVVEKLRNCWKVVEIDSGMYRGDAPVECPTVHCSTYESCIRHLKDLAKNREYKKVKYEDIVLNCK
jgi:hypothetical protein